MYEVIMENCSETDCYCDNKINSPIYLQLESRKFFYNKIFNIWKFYSI